MMQVQYRGGILLPAADLWLDPRGSRARAFVSHAHGDHAGKHGETYLSAATARLMAARIGVSPRECVMAFGQPREYAGGQMTLLPAGHVLGSAQFFYESGAGSLLYTGDFKLRPGLASEAIAWRHADTLVMETTFGLPRYVFPARRDVLAGMIAFCQDVLADGDVPVLLGYSLGKAQEILCALAAAGLPAMMHPSAAKITRIYREMHPGIPAFSDFRLQDVSGHVVIWPPSARHSKLFACLRRKRLAAVTGWGLDRSAVYRYGCEAVFPLSDHAGYDDLLRYVEMVSPRRVLTLHGYASEFARDLRARGMEAWSLISPDQLEFGI